MRQILTARQEEKIWEKNVSREPALDLKNEDTTPEPFGTDRTPVGKPKLSDAEMMKNIEAQKSALKQERMEAYKQDALKKVRKEIEGISSSKTA